MANKLDIVVAVQDNATAGLRKVNQGLNQLDTNLKKSKLGTNQFGQAVNDNTRGLSRFAKSGLQQTGYQVGDFAVQIAGGTSAIQAFGQQGSQLLGIFGPVGAILGAVVAIGAAIGVAYQKSTKDTKDFTTVNNNLSDALGRANTKGHDLIKTYEDLRDEYRRVTPEAIALTNAQRALNAAQIALTLNNARKALGEYSKEINVASGLTARLGRTNAQGVYILDTFSAKLENLYKDDLGDLAEALGVSEDKIAKLGSALERISVAQTSKQQIDAVTAALAILAEGTTKVTDKGTDLREILNSIGQAARTNAEDFKKLTLAEVEAAREAENAFERTKQISEGVAQSFGDAFKSIITGTKSVKDAFKNMARAIIDQLIQVLIVQQIVGVVGTGGAGSGGRGLAGILSGTRAMGGSVTAGKPYLVGEKGAELFIPHSAGRIEPNNKMAGGQVVVNQTINVSTGVQQTVRAEIATLLPQIAQASKAAVIDARRRGGNFASAFGS